MSSIRDNIITQIVADNSISINGYDIYNASGSQSVVNANTNSRVSIVSGTSSESSREQRDKRVSLNVAPLNYQTSASNPYDSTFSERVLYVLGQESGLVNGTNINGFLYNCLNSSCGLIFPYTPSVSVRHQVSYEETDITHSNLKIKHYRNTPPPSYSISALFTADTRKNALHMLSAIWFLRAVTKCDFGEQSNNPGMPPPTLYLNGYEQMMYNIPVVVTSFDYSLPQNEDYVSLSLDLSNLSIDSSTNESLFNLFNVSNLKHDLYNNQYFNTWLPVELKINISLDVQPNLKKYKKQFKLDNYKMGVYNLNNDGSTSTSIGTSSTSEGKTASTSDSIGVQCDNFDKSSFVW